MAKIQRRVAIDELDYEKLTEIVATLQLRERKHVSYSGAIHWLIEHSQSVEAPLPPEFRFRKR